MTDYSRRSFLRGSAFSLAAAAAAFGGGSLTGCAPNQKIEGAAANFADTIAWDGAYDVIVVGWGAAGSSAAYYAAKAGARVLLLEKAPLGHEGGNTRYCGQFILNTDDESKAKQYIGALYKDFEIDQDMLDAYVRGTTETIDLLVNDWGVDRSQMVNWKGTSWAPIVGIPEYEDLPGGDTVTLWTVHQGMMDGALWDVYRKGVTDHADMIDVWFESPAQHLIQDPISKTIVGVQVDKRGEAVNIRANNGVVLTCGGFENNKRMKQDYLYTPQMIPGGTLYNTGDGIRMAQEIGADLWHMSTYEGNGLVWGGISFPVEEGQQAHSIQDFMTFGHGSVVVVGNAGERYLREDEICKHGHQIVNGDGMMRERPRNTYMVIDQAQYDKITNADAIPDEYLKKMVSANTIADLENTLGLTSGGLQTTIKQFNRFAEEGEDPAFKRSAASMTAFSSSGPYYALEVIPSLINTQGGPRRNANAEILDPDGNVIPHLYSAGELGGAIAYQYNGGGNMAECLAFGKIAGTNAAATKADDLPAIPGKAESKMTYTPGAYSDDTSMKTDAPDVVLAAGQYLGEDDNGKGGPIYVRVTMDGATIKQVEVVQQNETPNIGGTALQALAPRFEGASSVGDIDAIDTISGATITSAALKNAVKNAYQQAK